MPDRMNTRAAAKYMGVAAGTLEQWRCKGKGPAYIRVGGKIVYARSTLTDYLRRHTVEPEGEKASA